MSLARYVKTMKQQTAPCGCEIPYQTRVRALRTTHAATAKRQPIICPFCRRVTHLSSAVLRRA